VHSANQDDSGKQRGGQEKKSIAREDGFGFYYLGYTIVRKSSASAMWWCIGASIIMDD